MTGIKFNQTTPKKVSTRIRKFLRTMGLDSDPIFLPFTYVSDVYKPRYCLSNCEHLEKISDSRIVFGWVVWEDRKNRFIEAEFHAVIKSGAFLVDITPRRDGEKKILFVPDCTRVARRENELIWCTWSNHKSFRGSILKALSPIKLQDVKSNVWE